MLVQFDFNGNFHSGSSFAVVMEKPARWSEFAFDAGENVAQQVCNEFVTELFYHEIMNAAELAASKLYSSEREYVSIVHCSMGTR